MKPLHEQRLTLAMAACLVVFFIHVGVRHVGYPDVAASMFIWIVLGILLVNLAAFYLQSRAQLEKQRAEHKQILAELDQQLATLGAESENNASKHASKKLRIAARQKTALSNLSTIRGNQPRWPH